jgi:hypothetical protein
MVAPQRLSRGFHRLGLFLALIPLLIGGTITINLAIGDANYASRDQNKMVCAHEYVLSQDAQYPLSPAP